MRTAKVSIRHKVPTRTSVFFPCSIRREFPPFWRPCLWLLIGLLAIVVGGLSTACAQQSALRPPADLSAIDMRVDALNAIARAQDYIRNTQRDDGGWYYESHSVGATSLVVMSLLDSGVPVDDPTIQRALAFLRTVREPHQVYDAAFQLMAFVQAGAEADRQRIERLADFLVRAQHTAEEAGPGAWGYTISDRTSWNNTNSQLALMALQAAVQHGVPVEPQTWQLAQQYWLTGRRESAFGSRGGVIWMSRDGDSTWRASIVMAAVASLDITSRMRNSAQTAGEDHACCTPLPDDAVQAAMIEGVRWLDGNYRVRDTPTSWESWHQYHFLNQSLIGHLSGRRTFGKLDWLRETTHLLLRTQNPRNGCWHDGNARQSPIVETALALRFLARGNAPVLIGKVQYGDVGHQQFGQGWNRHPRDAARLTEALCESPRWPARMQWEVIDLTGEKNEPSAAALARSKVWLLEGDGPVDLSDAEVQTLRQAIDRGCCLFAVNTCGSEEFATSLHDLVARLFPEGDVELKPLPASHAIHSASASSESSSDSQAPELWGAEIGCRLAVVFAPEDHACLWSRWTPAKQLPLSPDRARIDRSIQLAANLIAYVTNRELHDPLDIPPQMIPTAPAQASRGRMQIVRLRPREERGAAGDVLVHLPKALEAVGVRTVAEVTNLSAADSRLFHSPFAVMHSRSAFDFSPEEQHRLRTYVEQGGVLFADACCGSTAFDRSFRRFVRETFHQDLRPIPPDHELYRQPLGFDLRGIERRVLPGQGPEVPSSRSLELEGLVDDRGRYQIIYSSSDLSCSLDRVLPASRAAYSSEHSTQILTNVVIYSLAN